MKEKTAIFFRAKGGLKDGWGNIMRSRLMARYFLKHEKGAVVSMLIEGDDAVRSFMAKEGYDGISVKEKITLEDEERCLDASDPAVVITDMLKVPSGLLSLYRRHCRKLVIFNDMGYDYTDGDIIVNPQILASYPPRRMGQKHLNGTDYFILQEDIITARQTVAKKEVPARARNLLVIMGGSVEDGIGTLCSRVIDNLGDTDMKISFVLGYEHNISEKNLRYFESRNVMLVSGTDEIGSVMAKADIALASSGFVKYELAALGVPAVLVSIVDHQDALARAFAGRGACAEYAGNIHAVTPESLARSILGLAGDKEQRAMMAANGRRLVDGNARQRILKELFPA
ncbi:MAG: glycosyltransferase [Candidatus Omnitrophica bacterium]|nr:glycosyltransferase [Candidatus Omnitrophota bacterium]